MSPRASHSRAPSGRACSASTSPRTSTGLMPTGIARTLSSGTTPDGGITTFYVVGVIYRGNRYIASLVASEYFKCIQCNISG
jgi:hypothetical protein